MNLKSPQPINTPDSHRWAWPASKKGAGLQPYLDLAFVLAAEKHAAPIRLQTAYIT